MAFFVNDKEGDGRDVSWIWDIDFEELASQRDCIVFVGGERRNDLQVRLKYAGVDARLIGGVDEVFAALSAGVGLPADAGVYAIANYTALPVVHAALNEAAKRAAAGEGGSREDAPRPQLPLRRPRLSTVQPPPRRLRSLTNRIRPSSSRTCSPIC